MKIYFIGSVNAMPMMYARLFKQDGYDVKYIVDAPRDNLLSRPECHFEDISFPYPDWIKEVIIRRPSVNTLLPRFGFRKILSQLKGGDVYFLNDWYIALAPYLPEKSIKIIIPHGADLDIWCNPSMTGDISRRGKGASLSWLKKILASIVVFQMRRGLFRSQVVTYFPKGFNPEGERILDECSERGLNIVRRHDIDLTVVRNIQPFDTRKLDKFRICSAVRFDFRETPGVRDKYLKGNHLIIKGIAKFFKEVSDNIEVIFFEKGKDVEYAKELCEKYGISEIVKWNDTVPLNSLLKTMNESVVCFDQVGNHWLGAVGVYSLLLGKPLIANYDLNSFKEITTDHNPIFRAYDEESVFYALKEVYLRNKEGKLESEAYKEFVLKNFSAEKVYEKYLSLISSIRHGV